MICSECGRGKDDWRERPSTTVWQVDTFTLGKIEMRVEHGQLPLGGSDELVSALKLLNQALRMISKM